MEPPKIDWWQWRPMRIMEYFLTVIIRPWQECGSKQNQIARYSRCQISSSVGMGEWGRQISIGGRIRLLEFPQDWKPWLQCTYQPPCCYWPNSGCMEELSPKWCLSWRRRRRRRIVSFFSPGASALFPETTFYGTMALESLARALATKYNVIVKLATL